MNELSGRCLCESISFKLNTESLGCRICWCNDCQHISGNGTVNMIVPSEGLTIIGKVAEYKKTANSGNEVIRQFCPNCGIHLFAKSSGRPGLTILRIGNLDDPSSIQPTMNIWASSAPSWACFDQKLDRVEYQPSPPKEDKR